MPVNFTATAGLVAHVELEEHRGERLDRRGQESSPASSGRRWGILATRSAVASLASGWSEQIEHVALDRVVEVAELLGRHVVEARRPRGSGAAPPARWRATEPRGGTSGWNSLPIRVRALAIEMTTLPRRWPSTCWAVWVAPSHGVAMTTTSASAAPSLSPASMVRSRPAHCSLRPSTHLEGPVLRPRADHRLEADRRQAGRQRAAGRTSATKDPDAHRRHRSD